MSRKTAFLILANERIKMTTLLELLAASFVHSCDPYSGSCEARAELATWITEKIIASVRRSLFEKYI